MKTAIPFFTILFSLCIFAQDNKPLSNLTYIYVKGNCPAAIMARENISMFSCFELADSVENAQAILEITQETCMNGWISMVLVSKDNKILWEKSKDVQYRQYTLPSTSQGYVVDNLIDELRSAADCKKREKTKKENLKKERSK